MSTQPNTLLPERHQIADLQYTKNEYQGFSPIDRRAIFDLPDLGREKSLRFYRDLKNTEEIAYQTGYQEGLQEGLEQGKLEVVRNLLDVLDATTIAAKTGLSVAMVVDLRSRVSSNISLNL